MKNQTKFPDLLYNLHLAYKNARKNKRNTYNQIAFEINQEKNLYDLAQQVINRTYQPKSSIAFIVNKPVTREVFAADFSDRVIHHIIYNSIYKNIDNYLIYDTYSCRKGKGTHFGINRVKHFLLSATDNYQNDAYILKLDIKSYFMNMQHKIIYEKINTILSKKFNPKVIDFETLDYLLKQTIFINVKNNCRIKGKKSEWKSLPHDKSLFNKPDGIGLPIGNLTSQVFGNIYLNKIDHYIKNELGIKYYGRYVDDMIFVHPRKEKLLSVINPINNKLKEIGMKIHPQKIYLQHYDKGVFLMSVNSPHPFTPYKQ
ncbi:MAG: RNA-directed DNA polymerase [Bacteroidota bacterium]|nr:RNA-directed DNA polymerase [Bacteroidota bacterium]